MNLFIRLLEGVASTIFDVLPIACIILFFQLVILRQRIQHPGRLAIGFIYVLLGLTLFLVGLEEALFPIGELMAKQLTDSAFIFAHASSFSLQVNWLDYYWVYIFAAAVGFSTTIAEPSLIAVAIKAREVSGGAIGVTGLRVAVALGVAFGIALGAYRIVVGDPIAFYIIVGYAVVIIQTYFAPRLIVPLAYDSGGVTTSTVTVPLVAALGIGLAEGVPGRNPMIDGFGLIAFASLFPMISVMGYAQLTAWWVSRRQRPIETPLERE